MQKTFIANKDFQKEYARSRAVGHTSIVIDDDVQVTSPVKMVTDGTILRVQKTERTDDDEVYVIPCKEFGLTDYEGTHAKISVIFCDNDWMLVTLLQGAIIVTLDDNLLMPAIGDTKTPKVVKDDILWVNAEMLMGYSKYLPDTQRKFTYDYELVMSVTGQMMGGMSRFNIKFVSDEDIDLSQGYIAQYLQTMQNKEDARKAKKIAQQVMDFSSNGSDMEFDDDEEDPEYEDEEDAYDDEDYDY